MSDSIGQARERLARARRVAVLTGAGVSAESGIPTFRGAGGLWKNFDVTKLATLDAFLDDPKTVWEWYDMRRRQIATCLPNPAHHAIARLEQRVPEFLLITQNVDGLHAVAGSRKIAEMHGSIWKLRPIESEEDWVENRDVPLAELPPRNAKGRLLRPGVVWFGEMLPWREVEKMESFLAEPPDVLLVVGTSSQISWVQFVVMNAREAKTYVIEINTEETPLSQYAHAMLTGKAGEVVPELTRL